MPNATLKPRFASHQTITDELRNDWFAAIMNDPESFEVLVYEPALHNKIARDESMGEVPIFGQIETDQYEITYKAAQKFTASEVDNEDVNSFEMGADGGEAINVMSIMVATDNVPERSVIEFLTMSGGEPVLTQWYVMNAQFVGTQRVGTIYYLVPFNNTLRLE